jgi:hypothetical protein
VPDPVPPDGSIRLLDAIDIDRERAADLVGALQEVPEAQRSGITVA